MKATQSKHASPEAHCLQLASSPGSAQYDYYLVRIPMCGNVRVGHSFGIRLGDRAEQITTGRVWRVFVPIPMIDGSFRNYILCDHEQLNLRYVTALLRALQEFGLLEVAQVFTSDASAGVMRRVVSSGGGR